MDPDTEKVVQCLLQICHSCAHRSNVMSYTSPGFVEFIRDRPLSLSDIPMKTFDSEISKLAEDPKSVPWEDSIKNFILDCISVQPTTKYSTIFLLTGASYELMGMENVLLNSTMEILRKKHGRNSTNIISIRPNDEGSDEFNLVAKTGGKHTYSSIVDGKNLTTAAVCFYSPGNTLIMSHDSSIQRYRDLISLMPESRWSLSCTPSIPVKPEKKYQRHIYVLAVFSCVGSMETRSVGFGPVIFTTPDEFEYRGEYIGRNSYYLRCIRGSKHSSGRCYDCQLLYRTIISLGGTPNTSPRLPGNPKLLEKFVNIESNSISS